MTISRERTNSQLDKLVWEEIQRDIDSLVGMEAVKDQLADISRILANIQTHQQRYHNQSMPPLHFRIEGPPGGGKRRIAKILGKFLMYYNLAEELYMLEPGDLKDLEGLTARSVLYVHVPTRVLARKGELDSLITSPFWMYLEKTASLVNVILGLDTPDGPQLLEPLDFVSHIRLRIRIPDYTWPDFLTYARKYAAERKFKLSQEALAELRSCLDERRDEPGFANMVSIQQLIDQAIMNYYVDSGQSPQGRRLSATLQPQHFPRYPRIEVKPVEERKEELQEEDRDEDPLAELNALVGLGEVKTRLNQLMALVNLQTRRKEQGLPVVPITTHMAFSGAPGTGKTSVARLVGKALKKMGFLESGHFIEAAREDLVGLYVGHTARKTADLVDKAMGGVLFIDECYSLNAGYTVDYGREAVATLIKKMEDARDNLTVIFGGYTKEMEAFLDMNPGLRSRIQFHLIFPDYTGEELLQIFSKLCQEEGYELSEEAASQLQLLLDRLYENRTENFANGRLVRSLFERAKLSLADRVWANPGTNLNLLLPEDIQSLTTYDDLACLTQAPQRQIGFRSESA